MWRLHNKINAEITSWLNTAPPAATVVEFYIPRACLNFPNPSIRTSILASHYLQTSGSIYIIITIRQICATIFSSLVDRLGARECVSIHLSSHPVIILHVIIWPWFNESFLNDFLSRAWQNISCWTIINYISLKKRWKYGIIIRFRSQ